MLTLQQIIFFKFENKNKIPIYFPASTKKEYELLKQLSKYFYYTILNMMDIKQCIYNHMTFRQILYCIILY